MDLSTTNASFSVNVMPSAENSYNIGSSSLRWEDLYVDDGYIRTGYIDEYIYHNGDADTYLRFETNNVVVAAGTAGYAQWKSNGDIQVVPTYADAVNYIELGRIQTIFGSYTE